jgi:hypothetical protein
VKKRVPQYNMEASNGDIVGDIMRIRRNKVVQVVAICLVCGAAFVFFVAQLAATVFPRSRPTPTPAQSSRPNLRDADMDDVEPEAVVDDVDTELDRGKLLSHGVDITLSKYADYNTVAERVAKDYGSSTMFGEIRRDIKILSRDHDDWNVARDDVADKQARFTTYNTLTNQG